MGSSRNMSCDMLCDPKPRIDLLFTMSEITQAHPVEATHANDVSRTT